MNISTNEHDDLEGIIASLEQAWLTQAGNRTEASHGGAEQARTGNGEWWGD
ncbi:MAG: hypothetical protein RIS94_275 [Pseudomonadota bacterium]|jgi:hypothetical protein